MNTAELEQLSDVIGLIYEGATDPSRWTKDILPAVAEYIQAPECVLFTSLHTPKNGGYFFLHGIAQDHVDLYMSKYISDDVWTIAGVEKNVFFEGNVVTGDELVSREQLLESKIYKECFSLDKNMAQLMTSIVFGMDANNSMPAVCSFFRGFHHPIFCEEDRIRMRLVLPHLSRSLGVMQRIRSAELTAATTLAALDRLPTGVLLVDTHGEVTFTNLPAQRMLEDGDGLRLGKLTGTIGLGRLTAENDKATQAINDVIRATLNRDPYATAHFSQSISVPQTSGLASYTLQFSALGNHHEYNTGSNAPAAIIFIADGRQQVEIDPAVLRDAYGLTPTETKVAIALLEHATIQDVAGQLEVGAETVRSHVKQIYAKLGVDTRARFVKLMLGLAGNKV